MATITSKGLGDYAASMCWPANQKSKGKYKGGKKYPKYAEEFNRVKPQNASSIKIAQWRAGASCDIFVGCALRGYGLTSFPVTLRTQTDYFFIKDTYKSHFTKVTTSGKKTNMKHGDVVIGINKGSSNNGQGHIFIVNGNGSSAKRSNAHYKSGGGYYAVIDGFSDINTSKYKYFGVFRLKSTSTNAASAASTTKTTAAKVSPIAQKARQLAWPKGTSKSTYSYPGGHPTDAFKTAKKNTYGANYGWSTASKKGASCDMFAGVSVRASGYDKKWPAGLNSALSHAKSSSKWKEVNYNYDVSNLRPGDVMFSHHKKSKRHPNWPLSKAHHVFIYVGNGEIAEASAEKKYGYVHTMSIATQKKKESWVKAFRPTDPNYVGSDAGQYYTDDNAIVMDDGRSLVLEKEIAKLWSSNKYKWIEEEKTESEEEIATRQQFESLKQYLSNINVSESFTNVAPVDVIIASTPLASAAATDYKLDRFKGQQGSANLLSYPTLVEAPVIELSFNGVTIGGYGNSGDKYPNYISSMMVKKINGRINTYTINIVYQVRAGEDPNFIDKLLSNTGYTKPLIIKYGDANNTNAAFKQESAIITNVTSSENVSSTSINYTITAISSVTSADKSRFTFNEKIDKPSNVINDLLYNSGNASTQLLEAFPAMKNRGFVTSNNLIPTNDQKVIIGGAADTTPLSYLSHIVSCMVSADNNASSYFLSYIDGSNGAYFDISEVKSVMNTDVLYTVDVGYPGNNFVTNFQLCDNIYWPLVYEYNGSIPKWEYDIDNYGNINRTRTNSLFSDNKYMSTSVKNTNWWKSITEFPISAKLTLKGLVVPVMLMTYIRVNTLFYGEADIASGIYVVTEQEDSISGAGYTTTLTLLRVSD